MIQHLWRLVVSHPANVISIAALFGVLLVAFAVIETRLLSDGLPADVRGIIGLAFVVLFAYTAVAGTAYLLKFKLTKAAACLVTAGVLWGLYAATYEAGYDIIGCKPRYKTASDIDWQYVRQQVARQLNARKHPRPFVKYKRVLSADDIEVVDWTGPFDGALAQTIGFQFKIPDYGPEISGVVDICGNVEVW